MENPQGHGGISLPALVSDRDLDHEQDHPDFSPVGSPELDESPIPPPPTGQAKAVELSDDDLRNQIIKQVEYYFSDENLPSDHFLMKHVTKNPEGYVPIGIIASFRKIKKLTKDPSIIASALKESSLLVVSSNGKRVKRLHPLPVAEARDPMICTVLVENLPEDHSVENLRRMFGEAGNIKNITIREPHNAKEPKRCTVAEKLISGKLHALVEYNTVEAAEKAVAILNNEQDWRYGLRVKLLKKMKKPGQKPKIWKEMEHEKGSPIETCEPVGNEENFNPSEQHDDSHDEDLAHESREKNEPHLPKEKNGSRGRGRGRGRKQKYHGTNGQGHGHGHGTQLPAHSVEPSKPPPGPRMPDGTKGFTIGRGRTPAPAVN